MTDLPRVLLCSFDVVPGPTGGSRRLTEYVKALSNRFQVVVLSTKTPEHSHIERYHGARLLRVPVGSGDLGSQLEAFDRAVRRQLESEEYVLAHFTDPFGGFALCELREEYGYQLVYEACTFPSRELRYTLPHTEGDRRLHSKVRRQELFCLMSCDLVVTGSKVTRELIYTLGVPREEVRVVPAPVDLAPFSSKTMGKPDTTPMKVLYLGSQAGYQGLPTLLKAMQRAVRATDVRLVLVGPSHPPEQSHLEDLVAELELTGKVELKPPVAHEDLFKVLATCDVGVAPLDDSERNRLQGGPLAKISEYFAAARPVIAADLPIARERVPEGCGLFFPPGDDETLGRRLVELATNPALRVKLGAAARSVAERSLDATRVCKQLVDIYDELLGPRAAGAAKPATPDEPTPIEPSPKLVARAARQAPAKTEPAVPQVAPDQGALATDPSARQAETPVVMGKALGEAPEDDAGAASAQTLDEDVASLAATDGEEPEEVSDEEVVEADGAEDPPAPLTSRLDPWFSQLAHGYCPPEGAHPSRHPPPTNFPGRDHTEAAQRVKR
ncbi:MAG: glycosyltransferase [Myxococcota bacterium]